MWVKDTNLMCAGLERLGGVLPIEARCHDESVCDAGWGVMRLGDGFCEQELDKLSNTPECLWDGGDCK